MTTIIVSLFLPYTVDFAATESLFEEPETIENSRSRRFSSASGAPSAESPTISQPQSVSPQSRSLSLRQSRSTTPFYYPTDPHSIRHADSFGPEWGRSNVLNQPRASLPVQRLPSPNILEESSHFPFVDQRPPMGRHLTDGAYDLERIVAPIHGYTNSSWSIASSDQSNGGLVNAIRAAIDEGKIESVTWLGTLGCPTDVLTDAEKSEISDVLHSDYESVPVYPTDEEFDAHYKHFCRTILWPVLHYQQSYTPRSNAYETKAWDFYQKVNAVFAERIVQLYKRGDQIWVHDYHLMLVPALVREKLPGACISFFMHTPFPSSELFRCLAQRAALLNGILGANLLAFQTAQYAQHFLQACSRLLVVEVTEKGVQLEDRFVDVTFKPLGIIPDQLESALSGPEVTCHQLEISERYRNKKIIVSRTMLDITRGVRQSLLAYKKFLEKNPMRKGEVVFIQIAQASADYNGSPYAEAVYKLVNNINARFASLSHQPVTFLQRDISYAEYLALLNCADVFVVSALREGLSLSSFDYIISQSPRENGNKHHGVLILSEFAGASTLLDGSEISVNPWDTTQFSQAIKAALEMSEHEKGERHKRLRNIVMQKNGISWVGDMLTRLRTSYENHRRRDTLSVPRLQLSDVDVKYRSAKDRLFILDYEGTLSPWGSATTALSGAPQRMIDTLKELNQASHNNNVYVTSQASATELERMFRPVTELGLVAGNGCFVKPAGCDEWITLADMKKLSAWKGSVRTILEHYGSRIESSTFRENANSLTLDYSGTEITQMEAASRHAGDCANHVNESYKGWHIRAVPIDRSVVVESTEFSKTSAAKWILERHQKTKAEFECGMAYVEDVVGRMQQVASEKADATFSEETMSEKDTSRSRKSATAAVRSPIPELTPLDPDIDNYFIDQTLMDTAKQKTHLLTQNWFAPPVLSNLHQRVLRDDSAERGSHGSEGAVTSPDLVMSPISAMSPVPDVPISVEEIDPANFYKLPDTFDEFSPDFVFIAGDGREDEPVFRWANEFSEGMSDTNRAVPDVVTVCVGKKSTEAKFAVTNGPMGMLVTLQKLSRL